MVGEVWTAKICQYLNYVEYKAKFRCSHDTVSRERWILTQVGAGISRKAGNTDLPVTEESRRGQAFTLKRDYSILVRVLHNDSRRA